MSGNKNNYKIDKGTIILNKNHVLHPNISSYGTTAYCGLNIMRKNWLDKYYITSEVLSFYLLQKKSPRRFNEYISIGIKELVDNNIIKQIKDKEYNLSSLTLDLNNDIYVIVTYSEINKIMSLKTGNRFMILRYFIYLIGTISSKIVVNIDPTNSKCRVIGNLTIDYISQQIEIHRNTLMKYNKILEKAGLIYIKRQEDFVTDKNGKIKSLSNVYGRPRDKLYIDTYAHNQKDYKKSYIHTKSTKEVSNNKRKLAQKYINICKGKDYSKEETIEIFKYISSKNAYYEKLDEKNGNDYYADKIRDLSPFDKYGYLEDYM